MTTTLHNCGRLEVRNSPIEGFGVFATEDIKRGEVLEEVPFVLFPRYTALGQNVYNLLSNLGFISEKEKTNEYVRKLHKFKEPEKYYFKWLPPIQPEGSGVEYMVLPLGYGPIYNTANANNNAGWRISEKTFIFTAEKDIPKGEEIRTFYGYFLGEDGGIWNAEPVYYLAFDKNANNEVRLLTLRFQTPELIERAKKSQNYFRIQKLINSDPSGVRLVSLCLLTGEGEKAKIEIPPDASISFIYSRLVEYHRVAGSNVVIAEFEFKENGELKVEKVPLKGI